MPGEKKKTYITGTNKVPHHIYNQEWLVGEAPPIKCLKPKRLCSVSDPPPPPTPIQWYPVP